MPTSPANHSSPQDLPLAPVRSQRRWRRLALLGWLFGFLMLLGLCFVLLLPTAVAQAANKVIRHMFPGGDIECTITQISFYQANLSIDAREISTVPDRPGQRIVKLPHCRITYRPLAILRGRIDAIEIIGATMTARFEDGAFSLPLLKLLTQKTPASTKLESEPAAQDTSFTISNLPDIGHISLQSCTLMLRWENRFYHTPVALDLRQGDQGWENPQARASIRLNGQLLMLRDCQYLANTDVLSGNLRISEVRLDSLPPPVNTWAETHQLRGRLDTQATFKIKLNPVTLQDLTGSLNLTDLHARFGQEVISSPKLTTTLTWQEQHGNFTLNQLHATSMGLLQRLQWQFEVESKHASHGQLCLQFDSQDDEPVIIETAFKRDPEEKLTAFTMRTEEGNKPLKINTVWGTLNSKKLQAAITHTAEALHVDLKLNQAQLETPQADLHQTDLELTGSFQPEKMHLQATLSTDKAISKLLPATAGQLAATIDFNFQQGVTSTTAQIDCKSLELPEQQLQAHRLHLQAKIDGNREHLNGEAQLQTRTVQYGADDLKINKLQLSGQVSGKLDDWNCELQLAADDLQSVAQQIKLTGLQLAAEVAGAAHQFAGKINTNLNCAHLQKHDLTWNSIFWQQQFASDDTSPGMLTVASMQHKENILLAATVQTKLTPSHDLSSADLDLEASVLLQDFPTAQLQISSQNKVGKNILVSQNTFTLPPTELADLALERFLPAGVDLELEGTLSLSGSYVLGGGRPMQGNTKINLSQVDVALPKQRLSAEKLNLQFELPVLPELRTRAGQPIDCQKLQIANLIFTDLQTRFRLESADSLTLERVQAHWAGGTVHLGATEFNLKEPDFDLLLFCDRVNLAEIFQQLGNDQMSGHGALSGTLPIMINNGQITFGDGFLATVPGAKGDIRLAAAQNLAAGLTPGTPAYNQLRFSGDALRHFLYDWLKISLNSEADDLLFRLQVSGKPAEPLPYSYEKGEFVAIEGQTEFSQIQLDVNLRFPLNQLLHTFDEFEHLMQGLRP